MGLPTQLHHRVACGMPKSSSMHNWGNCVRLHLLNQFSLYLYFFANISLLFQTAKKMVAIFKLKIKKIKNKNLEIRLPTLLLAAMGGVGGWVLILSTTMLQNVPYSGKKENTYVGAFRPVFMRKTQNVSICNVRLFAYIYFFRSNRQDKRRKIFIFFFLCSPIFYKSCFYFIPIFLLCCYCCCCLFSLLFRFFY